MYLFVKENRLKDLFVQLFRRKSLSAKRDERRVLAKAEVITKNTLCEVFLVHAMPYCPTRLL